MSPLRKAYFILRYLGPGFAWERARIALARRTGRDDRIYQPRQWDLIDLARRCTPGTPTSPAEYAAFKRRQNPPFFFPIGRPPGVPATFDGVSPGRQPGLDERLRLMGEGRCVYFFRQPSPAPIEWNVNALTGASAQANVPWFRLGDFVAEQGDTRTLWEPSRCAWGYDPARAAARNMPGDWAALYLRWLQSWMQACPPFTGFQWKCGQESSVRFLALVFGFWALASPDEPASASAGDGNGRLPDEAWQQIARLAWATGYRVQHHIHYAVSQKNNHALSEAMGLMLVGQLFPEFSAAESWRNLGRDVMERELRRQIYDDGSYVQHSMNYHRVMLQDAIVAARLAELAGNPLARDVLEQVGQAADFLFEMMDTTTGRLPQYGNNDGALVLPLSECDFNDYRPAVQAAHYLAKRRRRLSPGPWDEDVLWLFGQTPRSSSDAGLPSPQSRAFDAGGYYTLRLADSWAMVRAHTYRDRPGHYDPLHLDLWWSGLNILQDCGTYQYFVPRRRDVEGYFKSGAAHNIVQIGDGDPVEKASQFLWFPWPRAQKSVHLAREDGCAQFEGQCFDYGRPPWNAVWRRSILGIPGEAWVVVDDLTGGSDRPQAATLWWHLLDVPLEVSEGQRAVRMLTPAGSVYIEIATEDAHHCEFRVVRGSDEPERVQGWASPYYAERLPIPTIEVRRMARLPLRLITVVSLGTRAAVRCVRQDDRYLYELAQSGNVTSFSLARPGAVGERVIELDGRVNESQPTAC